MGKFEVESVLMEHPAVAEAGVYGVPDDVAGTLIHAVVVLRPGVTDDEELHRSVIAHARRRLGAAVAPRQLLVVGDLPEQAQREDHAAGAGAARELGLPEGDLSTMEGAR